MPDKKKIFIYGAGGFGREIESWLEMEPMYGIKFEISGFIDEIHDDLNGYPSGYHVLNFNCLFDDIENNCVIIAIADIKNRKRIFETLKNKGIKIFTFVSSYSIVGKNTLIKEGSIICPNVVISTNVEIGKCTILNSGTQVGHDGNIGDYCSIMAQVEIGGHVKIDEEVFIGSKSVIIPRIKVYKESTIGAGSVVIRNIKESITVFGNPALKIKV